MFFSRNMIVKFKRCNKGSIKSDLNGVFQKKCPRFFYCLLGLKNIGWFSSISVLSLNNQNNHYGSIFFKTCL